MSSLDDAGFREHYNIQTIRRNDPKQIEFKDVYFFFLQKERSSEKTGLPSLKSRH